MSGVNKAILIGRLGRDPDIRYLPTGNAVCNFTMATSEKFGPDKQERTEWHRIVAFGKLAEICNQYLVKGKLIYIDGRIQTRDWEDKDGNKRTTTEIVANNMQMLDSAGGEKKNYPPGMYGQLNPREKKKNIDAYGNELENEDLPF
ncbi:single-stranded DNA-binding protein [Patescibacteria group bacterium]|nr:single-stranded DNA-binding protein [Patescibacteria group bacterium]